MKVLYSPRRSDNRIIFNYDPDIIYVQYNVYGWINKEVDVGNIIKIKPMWEVVESHFETFDFSSMPDGELEDLETHLPINPIISAKRTNGELQVELLNLIGKDATYEEKFPDWIEVS